MSKTQGTEGEGPLKVLVLLEGEHYVAQCLQFDIAAQASTMKDLREAFSMTFVENMLLAEAYGDDPRKKFGPAPEEYWKAWDKASDGGNCVMSFPLAWPERAIGSTVPTPQEAQLALK